VLDILVQRRRDKIAAKKFFCKLLKGCQDVPGVIIIDQLASYGAAKRESLPSVEHRRYCYLNNRAENSHQLTRQRERRMALSTYYVLSRSSDKKVYPSVGIGPFRLRQSL
jgi:putative transposase